jgi:hypothetical protein
MTITFTLLRDHLLKFQKPLRRRLFNTIASVLLLTAGLAPNAYAAQKRNAVPAPLKIVWVRDLGRKDAESIKAGGGVKAWAAACTNIAANLMAGKGPWGTGVFSTASCYIQDKGVDKKMAGKDLADPWVLRFIEGEAEATLSLYASEEKNAPLMSSAKFPGSVWAMKFFTDKGFAELVSMRLLNELPILGFVRKGSLEESLKLKRSVAYVPPSGSRLYSYPAPPLNLKIFTITKSNTVYLASLKGSAARDAYVDAAPAGEPDQTIAKKATPTAKYFVTWKFDEAAQVASANQHLAFHDALGAGKLVPELDSSINNAANDLHNAISTGLFSQLLSGIKSSTASGYVGLRFGKQVLPGNSLLKKLTFFGLVGEFRGGLFNGLRYYYNKVSEKVDSSRGISEKIGWSSHIIGKSFGMSLSHVFDRIDLTPKLGIWSIDAKLVTVLDENLIPIQTSNFNMSRGYSASLELGLEWNSSWYKIRPWASYDYAGAVSKISRNSITAKRVGLDTFLTVGPSFTLGKTSYKSALLGFAVLEQLTISDGSAKTASTESSSSSIPLLAMTVGFVGAGAALSW